MAIIKEMVGQKVIDGFRGVLDFYYHCGIPCVRTWPRSPRTPRSPQVIVQNQIFIQATAAMKEISPVVRQAYEDMVGTTNLTWKDMFYRGYLSGTLRYFFPVDELEETP